MRDFIISKAAVKYGAGLTATYVTEATAAGGIWETGDMTTGAIAVFNGDGSVIGYDTGSGAGAKGDVVAADLTDEYINIAMKGSNGYRSTVRIPRSNFSYVKKSYVAPVAAVKVLGNSTTGETGSYGSLNLPSSISVGDTVGVIIRDNTKQQYETDAYHYYSFAVTTGDLLTGITSSNIIAKLVAIVNADSTKVCTALALTDGTNNDGIKFTADTAGEDFNIILMDGVLKDADILEYKSLNRVYTSGLSAVVVENVVGNGTYAQAKTAESNASVLLGNTKSPRYGDKLYTATSDVVTDETYNVYSIKWTDKPDPAVSRENGFKQSLDIYVPNGENNAEYPEYELDKIFALVNP